MNAFELIQELMKFPPESPVLSVLIDPSVMGMPEVIEAELHTLYPVESMFGVNPKNPVIFIGSYEEFGLLVHLLTE